MECARARAVVKERSAAALKDAGRFELAEHFLEASQDVREDDFSLADLMWLANARIANANEIPFDPLSLADCPLVKLPAAYAHEGPVCGMDVCALYDTVEGLLHVVDGDLYSTDERTPEWFAELRTLFHVARQRAYFLACNAMDGDVHNEPEFRESRRAARKPSLTMRDGQIAHHDVSDLVTEDQNALFDANPAFVWDFCSRFSHYDLMMRALEKIDVEWGECDYSKACERVLESVKVDSMKRRFIQDFGEWAHSLAANRADLRIHHRRFPERRNISTWRQILIFKREFLVKDEGRREWDEVFDRADAVKYRLACDFALVLYSRQRNQAAVEKLVLDDWECLPPLDRPRLLRLRPFNAWGFVFEWPHVVACDSLYCAYELLKIEMRARGMPLQVPNPVEDGMAPSFIELEA